MLWLNMTITSCLNQVLALSAQVGLQQQRRIVVTHAAAQAVKADTSEEFIEV